APPDTPTAGDTDSCGSTPGSDCPADRLGILVPGGGGALCVKTPESPLAVLLPVGRTLPEPCIRERIAPRTRKNKCPGVGSSVAGCSVRAWNGVCERRNFGSGAEPV